MSEIQMGTIQWFPGHMTKTRRMIAANLSLVDAVVEILDARIPNSSQNPEMQRMVKEKPRMLLLNKADMADPNATARWVQYYQKKNLLALPLDCKTGKGIKQFAPAVKNQLLKSAVGKAGKVGHCRCPHTIDDCWHSQCGKIFVYQPDGTVQKDKGGRPSRCYSNQTMGQNW